MNNANWEQGIAEFCAEKRYVLTIKKIVVAPDCFDRLEALIANMPEIDSRFAFGHFPIERSTLSFPKGFVALIYADCNEAYAVTETGWVRKIGVMVMWKNGAVIA